MTVQYILQPFLLTFFIVSYGCATPPDAAAPQQSPRPPTEPAATVVDARPAALINGRSVSWGELRPMLSEAAGAEVLQEVILDRAIERALNDAGLTITQDAVDAERALLLITLSDDPNTALRLLEELRARQGLGTVRFRTLMHRNAALRMLVQPRVRVTEEAAQRMHDTIHGPKRQARLMTLPTLAQARQVAERINQGELFSDLAVELSTDASASRGGLLEPISKSDGSYPDVLRSTLFALEQGELSRPMLIDDRYVLIQHVRDVPGDDVTYLEVRDAMRQEVRQQQERALMDQYARELLREASITIFGESLNESWRMNRRGRR